MGCAKRVHATLGFGFLESAYGDAMEIEFTKAGIPYAREDQVRIYYDGKPLTEIAEMMQLSYGAVKLRHQNALMLLREYMK